MQAGTVAKVTVVIVNWNAERFLDRCLTHLLAQTVMPHEIIVVDNASSDNSCNIVNGYASVRLVALQTNTGFARANNLAIQISRSDSEWIALLNPDAFAEPGWLQELMTAAQNNPTYSFFSSKLLVAADASVLDGAGDAYHVSGIPWRMGHGKSARFHGLGATEVFSPCAAAALYKRQALLEVDGFDEDFFCYVEDVDLGFRLRLKGHRCLYVPASVALHVGSGTTGDKHSDFVIYHGHRNLVWAYVKNMPPLMFWMFLPLHLMVNVLLMWRFTKRGQGRVIWKAKRDALAGLLKMWSKRRQIQSTRQLSSLALWRVLTKRSR
jgi:GT2 family glycosyltransferase